MRFLCLSRPVRACVLFAVRFVDENNSAEVPSIHRDCCLLFVRASSSSTHVGAGANGIPAHSWLARCALYERRRRAQEAQSY